MFEDAAIEQHLFRGARRVFCIASAGCTAMALARLGHCVTAVDINSAQIDYVRSRCGGGPVQAGDADRVLRLGRWLLWLAGLTRGTLQQFLSLSNLEVQRRVWRGQFDNRRLRLMLRAAFSRFALRRAYGLAFVESLSEHFAESLVNRLARGFARHPNRTNPYAWWLWLGSRRGERDGQASTLAHATPLGKPELPSDLDGRALGAGCRLVCADAVEFLSACPAGSFDAFSLSNILDGANQSYASQLWRAVRRAAAPGAISILRSLAEPQSPMEASWAACDRAMLWGSISVRRWRAQSACATPQPAQDVRERETCCTV
jgi:S-adenosylmethionine:diacylglycerol 3-amino-3-carboxypropyl transferase